MNFKEWLNEAAILMSPAEAVRELGLSGENLDGESLNAAYRRVALDTHPDRNPDPDAAKRFKRAAEAYEVLRPFVGGPMPGEGSVPPTGRTEFDPGRDARDEFYRQFYRQLAPTGQYSSEEFEEWLRQIVEKQYFQVKVRQTVGYVTWGLKLGKDEHTMPLGSVTKTFRVTGYARKGTGVQKTPMDSLKELFSPYMSRLPEFIVDMKLKDAPNWREAWITMELPSGKYQSVSFFPVEKKETKAPGVGMKREEIEEHLRNSGLRFAGGYTAGDNYGVDDSPVGYFVQLGSKVVRVIVRHRGDRYGKKTIETVNRASEHYGKITKELLDKYIAFVKRQSQKAEAFVHDGGMDNNFAMAVYSIMHNKASAADWDLIDSVPVDDAMQKIRRILSDNGIEGRDLDAEMEWWRTQIGSTAKWN
jgi:hypothetical protein